MVDLATWQATKHALDNHKTGFRLLFSHTPNEKHERELLQRDMVLCGKAGLINVGSNICTVWMSCMTCMPFESLLAT